MFQIHSDLPLMHYKTLLEEAENERLIDLVIRTKPARPNWILLHLGNILISIGERLQSIAFPETSHISGREFPVWKNIEY